MSFFENINKPMETELLIAFTDIRGFVQICNRLSDMEMFDLMNSYFGWMDEIIEGAGGKVLKTYGDAAMIVFSKDDAEKGVQALIKVSKETPNWMNEKGHICHLDVKIHFGTAVIGSLGNSGRIDIYGQEVNTCACLPAKGLSVSESAFEYVSADAKEDFKSHTLPIAYYSL